MLSSIAGTPFYRYALRAAVMRSLARRLPFIPYPSRLAFGIVQRPQYGYCVFNAAKLARQLGQKKISVIEFGIGGGDGLVNLEMHAIQAKKYLGVEVEVYGFDRGEGLPEPQDYRDMPYNWRRGLYRMNEQALRQRLHFSQLIIGDVADTVPTFFQNHKPAPIAALMMDLDFYSSTREALLIFDSEKCWFLPRVFLYFDDLLGGEKELYCDFTGERLAIREFNHNHEHQKICETHYLKLDHPYYGDWRHAIYIYHDFLHDDYNKFVSGNV